MKTIKLIQDSLWGGQKLLGITFHYMCKFDFVQLRREFKSKRRWELNVSHWNTHNINILHWRNSTDISFQNTTCYARVTQVKCRIPESWRGPCVSVTYTYSSYTYPTLVFKNTAERYHILQCHTYWTSDNFLSPSSAKNKRLESTININRAEI